MEFLILPFYDMLPSCVDKGNHPLRWSLESDLGNSIVAMTTASPGNFGEVSDVFFLSGGHFFYGID
jgi:hypothetical protein